MGRKKVFRTAEAGRKLLNAMAQAIENITLEVARGVDPETTGSNRRAELKSIRESALDAKDLITEYQKLEAMVKELEESGDVKESRDYSGGFAEEFSK